MRGNQELNAVLERTVGPIPARAGEPGEDAGLPVAVRAYPRACGGTRPASGRNHAQDGLSPRVRGNRLLVGRLLRGEGPIPARAGEPPSPRREPWVRGAYPRACGGTDLRSTSRRLGGGLSPRVRGNLVVTSEDPLAAGPIPARAGEPNKAVFALRSLGAYPRACGGTCSVRPMSGMAGGLSPRVRGNHQAADLGRAGSGPIPARAGEPCSSPTWRTRQRAYPRACGGTGANLIRVRGREGLSPRVRGNHAAGVRLNA